MKNIKIRVRNYITDPKDPTAAPLSPETVPTVGWRKKDCANCKPIIVATRQVNTAPRPFLKAKLHAAALRALPAGQPEVQTFVLVSGCPRSGTSLMMQMLAAGGLPSMTDGKMAANAANPGGYCEWTSVRKFRTEPSIILEAFGKAIKVFVPLLRWLPKAYNYKVIFMDRAAIEVAASQIAFYQARRQQGHNPLSVRTNMIDQTRTIALRVLQDQKNVSVLVVNYGDVVADPAAQATRVAAFVGLAVDQVPAMAALVKPELYRFKAAVLSKANNT